MVMNHHEKCLGGAAIPACYFEMLCGGVRDAHDCVSESLSEALKGISVSTELVEEELKPHLDVLLNLLLEKSESTPLTTPPQSIYKPLCVIPKNPYFSTKATSNAGAKALTRAC